MANEEVDDCSEVRRVIEERARAQKNEDFVAWCSEMESTLEDYQRKLGDGWVADLELSPHKWIRFGCDIMECSKGVLPIQTFAGSKAGYLKAYLPFPVFQMGVEIFLKGMWLYSREECRKVDLGGYLDEATRHSLATLVKRPPLGDHDLMAIIGEVVSIEQYGKDEWLSRFLKIVSGATRRYYFPLHSLESPTRGKRPKPWAEARYPWRVYNDEQKDSKPLGYQEYPPAEPISRLFTEAAQRIECLWQAQ